MRDTEPLICFFRGDGRVAERRLAPSPTEIVGRVAGLAREDGYA
jgi:hypothetical protein